MVTRYTQQFLRNVLWNEAGDLDVLILDLPPGTGDIQLTIVQTVPLTGTVIVSTPQEVALIDARKAVSMFGKTNVPILGILENMSGFFAPDGSRHEIFGSGGGEREAARLGVPFLGALPLDPALRIAADEGMPLVLANPDSTAALIIRDVASNLAALVR
jgi:ATP-binding protein involved in chromosome partitioning